MKNNNSLSFLWSFVTKAIAFLLLSLGALVHADTITLDGKLNEPAWETAEQFDEFETVKPYSLSQPIYKTKVLMFSSEEGIYIGFKNTQPIDSQVTEQTARDVSLTADINEVNIDFNNNKQSAYSFQVGNGGSVRDGIIRNENQFSNEWDGRWLARTSRDQNHWYSEIFIPWDITSIAFSETLNNEQSITLGIYFSRTVRSLEKVYAIAPTTLNRQSFISEFKPVNIKAYVNSILQKSVYVSARQDRINDESTYNFGGDVFWKARNGLQLSATVNPDFGQVESDNLVVNFSPNETFFSERRPFFIQNQSIFDVRGNEGLRLINTRRIGGRPDAGPEQSSDILGAVKLSNEQGIYNYGLFAAWEADSSNARGRDYYVGRWLRNDENLDVGLTSTFTNSVTGGTKSWVTALDYKYDWDDQVKLSGQLLHSNIKNPLTSISDNAIWIKAEQQLSETSNHYIELSHYGTDFRVNDLGFIPRANLNSAYYFYGHEKNDYSVGSKLNRRRTWVRTDHQFNNSGDHLVSSIRFLQLYDRKNTSSWNWYIEYFGEGKDDRITRGNNILKTDAGYEASVTLFSKTNGKFRNHGYLDRIDTFNDGKGWGLHIHPSYQFTDKLSTSLGIYYTDTQDWINWIEGNNIGEYQRKQLRTVLNADANFSEKHELRLKFQWIALTAQAENNFNVLPDGNRILLSESTNDFSFSDIALQLRYRYQIAPLSNLFIVYTRGGSTFVEDRNIFRDLFSTAWNENDGNNILVKMRYQF